MTNLCKSQSQKNNALDIKSDWFAWTKIAVSCSWRLVHQLERIRMTASQSMISIHQSPLMAISITIRPISAASSRFNLPEPLIGLSMNCWAVDGCHMVSISTNWSVLDPACPSQSVTFRTGRDDHSGSIFLDGGYRGYRGWLMENSMFGITRSDMPSGAQWSPVAPAPWSPEDATFEPAWRAIAGGLGAWSPGAGVKHRWGTVVVRC